MEGRAHVTPLDIQHLLPYSWNHRLHLTDEAQYDGVTVDDLIDRCLNR